MFWYSFLQKRKASGGRVVSRTKKKYVFEVCLSQSFLNSSKSISDDWLIGICWNSFLFASYTVLVPWITLVWWIPKNIFYQWYWVKVFIIYHISNYIIIYYYHRLFISLMNCTLQYFCTSFISAKHSMKAFQYLWWFISTFSCLFVR